MRPGARGTAPQGGPRVEPASPERHRQLERELFGNDLPDGAGVLNLTRTWALHPELMKAQRPLQDHVLEHSTLDPRDRELAILRVGWLCGSPYEFGQHREYGRRAGLSDAEVERVTKGPEAPGWTPEESLLLRAVDELHDHACWSEATWEALSRRYRVPQLLDLIVLVGRYWTVCAVASSFGVQLEDGKPGFPR